LDHPGIATRSTTRSLAQTRDAETVIGFVFCAASGLRAEQVKFWPWRQTRKFSKTELFR
jgi:hypothetical protein